MISMVARPFATCAAHSARLGASRATSIVLEHSMCLGQGTSEEPAMIRGRKALAASARAYCGYSVCERHEQQQERSVRRSNHSLL